MNTLLLAVDDGIAQGNLNWADVFFLIAVVLAGLAGLAYALGVTATATANPPRYHAWAPALVAFAVGCVAFALFLL